MIISKLIWMIIFILRDVLIKMADILADFRRKNGEDATFPPDIKEFCPMNGPCGLYVLDLFTKPNPIYRLPQFTQLFWVGIGVERLMKNNHNELLNLELFW